MRRTCRLSLGTFLFLCIGTAPAVAAPLYALSTLIPVPASAENSVGGAFATYDISFFDPLTQLDYVADRSNASVDIFSSASNTFVGRIGGSGQLPPLFSGQQASNATSGPDGVVVVNLPGQHQVWAGNGDSTLKGFNIPSNTLFATIPTGTPSQNRVDEMAFDPNTKVLVAANNAAPVPFITLVNTTTNAIIKQVPFDGTNSTPNAIAGGIEQPAFNPVTKTFFVSVPQIGNSSSNPGGVTEFDAQGNILHTYDFSTFAGVTACSPAGLVAATNGHLLVGCSATTGSIILDPTANGGNGSVKVIPQVTGSDEVAFDPTTNLFFLAARSNPGGPVLGIIDALTDTWLQNLPTTPADHSVSVDPITNEVFVPFGGVAGNSVCPNGCVAVFAAARIPEPGSLLLLLAAFAAMFVVSSPVSRRWV
jgi:WD40 repeat protein